MIRIIKTTMMSTAIKRRLPRTPPIIAALKSGDSKPTASENHNIYKSYSVKPGYQYWILQLKLLN